MRRSASHSTAHVSVNNVNYSTNVGLYDDWKALTRGRTDHIRNILADHEFSAACYLFEVQFRYGLHTGSTHSVNKFSESTPIRAACCRPHIKYSLLYS